MHPFIILIGTLAQLACGLPDRGIYPEYDALLTLAPLPAETRPAKPWLRVDPVHRIVTLYDGADALKAWPASIAPSFSATAIGAADLHAGDPKKAESRGIALRESDWKELTAHAPASTRIVRGAPARDEDRDGDGVVDRIDILLGAKKLTFNKAHYIERYVSIKYPGGDVPRTEGVCSDTVIRALRNAGIDLQKEVHEDILRARSSYPMVEKVDASINHRRVRTILPWFQRHFVTLPAGAPYLPGDIVFLDTFPSKPGPDHLGVVSDTLTDSGHYAIINNWTEGWVESEMDLLRFVPVTHHFRAPTPAPPIK